MSAATLPALMRCTAISPSHAPAGTLTGGTTGRTA